jgi:hypothetical protein
VGLSSVVLPQLGVCVQPSGELGQVGQRRAVGKHRDHGARGEVGADADHPRSVDARVLEGGWDGDS